MCQTHHTLKKLIEKKNFSLDNESNIWQTCLFITNHINILPITQIHNKASFMKGSYIEYSVLLHNYSILIYFPY